MTDEMKAKRELLFSGSKNGYDRVDQQTLDAMEAYCRDYKSFLDHSKTERECTAHTVALAEAAGFIPYERHGPAARRPGVPGEPEEERDAGRDRPGEPVRGRTDRGLPHRLSPSGSEASSHL